MQKNSTLILWSIIIISCLYHSAFLWLNDVLKVADSFAYLQMAEYLRDLDAKWLWSGWFGFLYSLPIFLAWYFTSDLFLVAKIINIFLFWGTLLLLWRVSRLVLSETYCYLTLILFSLSPTFLHFNIHVLSENIYIPLFLGVFLITYRFTQQILRADNSKTQILQVAWVWCLIGLMYLTRAEAFIYILSVGIISITLLIRSHLSYTKFLHLWSIFFLSFFLLISPYLFHLHSITWEWWLTNKGASNLRQAELRWVEKMDDSGFEKAVAELTEDKSQLIAWFAGWMEYVKPQIGWSLWDFILDNPRDFVLRVWKNQKKLISKNIPEIFLWKSPHLYFSGDPKYSHIFFLLFVLTPLWVLMLGIYNWYKKYPVFSQVLFAYCIPALIFFTLFFTLNRYFLIFLPFLIILFSIGLQSISLWKYSLLVTCVLIWNYIAVLLLSTLVYYNTEKDKDSYYEIKKQAGVWLSENLENTDNLGLMERFPIVTYYSWSRKRYITPYSDTINDVYTYGSKNNIDLLVVDSLDFLTYRPSLSQYLERVPEGFTKLQEFSNPQWQKVILYQLKK